MRRAERREKGKRGERRKTWGAGRGRKGKEKRKKEQRQEDTHT